VKVAGVSSEWLADFEYIWNADFGFQFRGDANSGFLEKNVHNEYQHILVMVTLVVSARIVMKPWSACGATVPPIKHQLNGFRLDTEGTCRGPYSGANGYIACSMFSPACSPCECIMQRRLDEKMVKWSMDLSTGSQRFFSNAMGQL